MKTLFFLSAILLIFACSCSKRIENASTKQNSNAVSDDNKIPPDPTPPPPGGPTYVDDPPPPDPLPPLTPDELYALGKINGCNLRMSARTAGTQSSTIYSVIVGYTANNQPIVYPFSIFEVYTNTTQNVDLPWEYRMGFTDGWVECRYSNLTPTGFCQNYIVVPQFTYTNGVQLVFTKQCL